MCIKHLVKQFVINTFFMQSAAVWSGLCFTDLIKREVKGVDVSHTIVKVSDFLPLGHNEKTFFNCHILILFGPQFKTSKRTKTTVRGGYSFMFLAAFVVDLCIKYFLSFWLGTLLLDAAGGQQWAGTWLKLRNLLVWETGPGSGIPWPYSPSS